MRRSKTACARVSIETSELAACYDDDAKKVPAVIQALCLTCAVCPAFRSSVLIATLSAGDILMFLPGQDDIHKAVKMLNEGVASLPADSCMDLLVLPIYAALPPDLQVLHRRTAFGVLASAQDCSTWQAAS